MPQHLQKVSLYNYCEKNDCETKGQLSMSISFSLWAQNDNEHLSGTNNQNSLSSNMNERHMDCS